MIKLDKRGFTIIELLIATVVFSLILLVITGAIVQFNKIYYKGIIISRTQERARAITQDIAQNLQFSRDYTPGASYFCAGTRRFSYTLGKQLGVSGPNGSPHVLVADTTSGGCSGGFNVAAPGALPAGATELLGENMQLVALNITSPSPDVYRISVRVVYGADGDFQGGNPANGCRTLNFGGQFCAVAELTTTVSRRLKE